MKYNMASNYYLKKMMETSAAKPRVFSLCLIICFDYQVMVKNCDVGGFNVGRTQKYHSIHSQNYWVVPYHYKLTRFTFM